jgi:hypothetical protein
VIITKYGPDPELTSEANSLVASANILLAWKAVR